MNVSRTANLKKVTLKHSRQIAGIAAKEWTCVSLIEIETVSDLN